MNGNINYKRTILNSYVMLCQITRGYQRATSSSGTLLPLPIQGTVVEDQHHPAEFRRWARKRKSCACAAPGDACGNGGIQHQKTMGNKIFKQQNT